MAHWNDPPEREDGDGHDETADDVVRARRWLRAEVSKNMRSDPLSADTVLTEDQFRGLIRYLQTTFCGACNGTGFDPDTLDGKCETCADMPF
jgi:hypothetical protein